MCETSYVVNPVPERVREIARFMSTDGRWLGITRFPKIHNWKPDVDQPEDDSLMMVSSSCGLKRILVAKEYWNLEINVDLRCGRCRKSKSNQLGFLFDE